VDLVALPEVFALRGADEDFRRAAEPLPGRAAGMLARMAAERGCWILAGSVIEREDGAIYNTSVVLDRAGRIAAAYRKIHLFEVNLEAGARIREEDIFRSGGPPRMVVIEGWRCGLSICYDLRFPELYRHYAREGAHLLFAPSNFTQRTGRDHWDILVRARAIENQCYLVAPAQCGANPCTGIVSHGHSLVAGPWGEPLAEAGDEETTIYATLSPDELHRIRKRIPALEHRRL
jgi:predicted amidohydrolase